MISASERGEAPTLCVAGLRTIRDSLVLVRRSGCACGGCWDLPRGVVGSGETVAEALVRCMERDTGELAVCGPFAGWTEDPMMSSHTVTMYFNAVVLDGARPRRPTGHLANGPAGLEVRAVPTWEVTEMRLHDGLAEFLSDQGIIDLLI